MVRNSSLRIQKISQLKELENILADPKDSKDLKELYIEGGYEPDYIPDLSPLENLRILEVGTTHLSDKEIPGLYSLKNLEKLSLARSDARLDERITNLDSLEELNLMKWFGEGDVEDWINDISNLRSLHFTAFNMPNSLNGLKKLDTVSIQAHDSARVRLMDPLGDLENLERVYIDGFMWRTIGKNENLKEVDGMIDWFPDTFAKHHPNASISYSAREFWGDRQYAKNDHVLSSVHGLNLCQMKELAESMSLDPQINYYTRDLSADMEDIPKNSYKYMGIKKDEHDAIAEGELHFMKRCHEAKDDGGCHELCHFLYNDPDGPKGVEPDLFELYCDKSPCLKSDAECTVWSDIKKEKEYKSESVSPTDVISLIENEIGSDCSLYKHENDYIEIECKHSKSDWWIFTPREGVEDDDFPIFTGEEDIVNIVSETIGDQYNVHAYDSEKGWYRVNIEKKSFEDWVDETE